MSTGVMDTPLERIHTKIAELETKIADLRVAEREILALDQVSAHGVRAKSDSPTEAQGRAEGKRAGRAAPDHRRGDL